MQEESFKCEECGKECRQFKFFSEYGMSYYNEEIV
jgi:hypothetical protein